MTIPHNLATFVSVIIPVYNDPKGLQKCLEAMENQSYPKTDYEVLVVDNGSSNSQAHITDTCEGHNDDHATASSNLQGPQLCIPIRYVPQQGVVLCGLIAASDWPRCRRAKSREAQRVDENVARGGRFRVRGVIVPSVEADEYKANSIVAIKLEFSARHVAKIKQLG